MFSDYFGRFCARAHARAPVSALAVSGNCRIQPDPAAAAGSAGSGTKSSPGYFSSFSLTTLCQVAVSRYDWLERENSEVRDGLGSRPPPFSREPDKAPPAAPNYRASQIVTVLCGMVPGHAHLINRRDRARPGTSLAQRGGGRCGNAV